MCTALSSSIQTFNNRNCIISVAYVQTGVKTVKAKWPVINSCNLAWKWPVPSTLVQVIITIILVLCGWVFPFRLSRHCRFTNLWLVHANRFIPERREELYWLWYDTNQIETTKVIKMEYNDKYLSASCLVGKVASGHLMIFQNVRNLSTQYVSTFTG